MLGQLIPNLNSELHNAAQSRKEAHTSCETASLNEGGREIKRERERERE